MAGLKQIKSRLKSVNNTKKITYAMKLVSAAKLRKAQDAVSRSRQYTQALAGLVAKLSVEMEGSDVIHPLMVKPLAVKRIRVLVVGGSRGLCGGYNSNLNRRVFLALSEFAQTNPGAAVESVLLGKKPAEFFRRTHREYLASFETLPDEPVKWPLEALCQELENDFRAGNVDEVHIIYTRFRTAMSQTVVMEKLLPMDADMGTEGAASVSIADQGATLFEPSIEEVFSALLPRILRSRVLQAALESKASEHGSRMTAMDAASKNAGDIAYSLRLLRNRVRQANVTSDLLDIIGGAEALNK